MKKLLYFFFTSLLLANENIVLNGEIDNNINLKISTMNSTISINKKIKTTENIKNYDKKINEIIGNKCYINNNNIYPIYIYKNHERNFQGYNIKYQIYCENIKRSELYKILNKFSNIKFKIHLNNNKPSFSPDNFKKIIQKNINKSIQKIKKEIAIYQKTSKKICILKNLKTNYNIENNNVVYPIPLYRTMLLRTSNANRQINKNYTTNAKLKIKITYQYQCY